MRTACPDAPFSRLSIADDVRLPSYLATLAEPLLVLTTCLNRLPAATCVKEGPGRRKSSYSLQTPPRVVERAVGVNAGEDAAGEIAAHRHEVDGLAEAGCRRCRLRPISIRCWCVKKAL